MTPICATIGGMITRLLTSNPPPANIPATRMPVLIFALLALTLWVAHQGEAQAGEAIGQVSDAEGLPQASTGGRALRALREGSGLFVGDELHVPQDARLMMDLSDGSKLSLGANSRLVLERLVYSKPNHMGHTHLNLLAGPLYIRTDTKRRGKTWSLLIVTPFADVIVGTAGDAWLHLSPDKLTLGTLRGTVQVVPGTGDALTLATPGTAVRVTASGPSRPVPVEKKQLTTLLSPMIKAETMQNHLEILAPDKQALSQAQSSQEKATSSGHTSHSAPPKKP